MQENQTNDNMFGNGIHWDSRLSKAQVMAIARDLHHDERGIEDTFAMMMQAADNRAAYNAAWILTHLSQTDKNIYLLPKYAEIVRMATSAATCFRRGLILAILSDLPIAGEPNSDLLDFCLKHITDTKEYVSARSSMIKLAARMCKPYPELCTELTLCLDMIPQGISPSIASAKRKALKTIAKR